MGLNSFKFLSNKTFNVPLFVFVSFLTTAFTLTTIESSSFAVGGAEPGMKVRRRKPKTQQLRDEATSTADSGASSGASSSDAAVPSGLTGLTSLTEGQIAPPYPASLPPPYSSVITAPPLAAPDEASVGAPAVTSVPTSSAAASATNPKSLSLQAGGQSGPVASVLDAPWETSHAHPAAGPAAAAASRTATGTATPHATQTGLTPLHLEESHARELSQEESQLPPELAEPLSSLERAVNLAQSMRQSEAMREAMDGINGQRATHVVNVRQFRKPSWAKKATQEAAVETEIEMSPTEFVRDRYRSHGVPVSDENPKMRWKYDSYSHTRHYPGIRWSHEVFYSPQVDGLPDIHTSPGSLEHSHDLLIQRLNQINTLADSEKFQRKIERLISIAPRDFPAIFAPSFEPRNVYKLMEDHDVITPRLPRPAVYSGYNSLSDASRKFKRIKDAIKYRTMTELLTDIQKAAKIRHRALELKYMASLVADLRRIQTNTVYDEKEVISKHEQLYALTGLNRSVTEMNPRKITGVLGEKVRALTFEFSGQSSSGSGQ